MMHAKREVTIGKLADRAREVLLTLAAALGLVSLVAVSGALFFGMSLIVFKTGSMSPTIPTGAVAVIRKIPATEVKVGEVVTLYRPGVTLPITHRVLTAVADPGVAGGMFFTMKGDANPVADPITYSATTARKVVWSVAGGGSVLLWVGHPWVLLVLTGVVTALVTWTFWPRRQTTPSPSHSHRARTPHHRLGMS